MKTERARELYSDYAEGTLTPAFKQALEQHFEADPEARADFQQFLQVYALLDAPEARAEVEVPLGFRAKVLELAAQEQARREAAPSRRAAVTLTGWFRSWGHRRQATGGLIAAFAVATLAAVVIHNVNSPAGNGVGPDSGGVGPGIHLNLATPSTIQGVTDQAQADGSVRHLFQIHLPTSVKQASVQAYVVRATDQITNDAARQQGATPAFSQPISLSNDQTMQIPVTLVQPPTAGQTLNLYVTWTPTDGNQPTGRQVVFAPLSQTGGAGEAPASHFYDALQSVAASYGVTVISDATPGNVDISAPPAGGSAQDALKAVARQLPGYDVAALGDGHTYQVYATR